MTDIKDLTISVIGSGNMGTALIKGLVNKGRGSITACDTDSERLKAINIAYKIKTTEDLSQALADIIIVAVKPNGIKELCEKLAKLELKNALIISVAAGVKTSTFKNILGNEIRITRVMPNIPAVVGQAASAIYSGIENDSQLANEIFSSIGKCFICKDEAEIDVATALCGSGPAFVAYFIEALTLAAKELGIEQNQAQEMALQTAYGTCLYLLEQKTSPAKLREMVSSPGGTTLAGLKNLEDNDFSQVVLKALQAATKRAREIASQH